MAILSRQIGWGTESNLLWQILKQLNKLTAVIFGLKEAATPKYKVFTALLTQKDGSHPSYASNFDLTVGTTYRIQNNSGGADFTIAGAPDNNVDTYFIATNSYPNWGEGTAVLSWDDGAPVATILENTIGDIVHFEYNETGVYSFYVSGEIPEYPKTFFALISPTVDSLKSIINLSITNGRIQIYTFDYTFTASNDILAYTPIEIRIYN